MRACHLEPKTTSRQVWGFTTLGPGGGVKALYFRGKDLAGDPILSQIEDTIDHPWGSREVVAGISVDTLVLYVRGDVANDAVPLYVAVEDSGGRSLVVTHPDDTIVTTTEWTEWKISSVDFINAGVSLSSVKKMYLGTGGRNATGPSGAGLLYFDDIRVTRPGPDEGGQ